MTRPRVVILAGRGPAFTVGIDIKLFASLQPGNQITAEDRHESLPHHQGAAAHRPAASPKSANPVIAAVHGYCLGGGMDLITACDIRVASKRTQPSRYARPGWAWSPMWGYVQRLPAVACGQATPQSLPTRARASMQPRPSKIGLVNAVLPSADAALPSRQEDRH